MRNNCRADFPLLKNSDLIRLDSAATSQKSQCVIDRLSKHYQGQSASAHRALCGLSEATTARYEQARKYVADFINADRDEVVFTRGTTQRLNRVANGFIQSILKPGGEILISIEEYYSNLAPWQIIAKEAGTELVCAYLTSNLEFDYDDYEARLDSKTKIVALHHMPDALGNILDLNKIAKSAHSFGAYLVVDRAQVAAHTEIDVQEFDCDFYASSDHKIPGPAGVDVLFGKKNLPNQMTPVGCGGEMIGKVSQQSISFKSSPLKFEAGTQSIAGAIGLDTTINCPKQVKISNVKAMDCELCKYAGSRLEEIGGVSIYGGANNGIISFNLDDICPHDVVNFLGTDRLCLRVRHHCAKPLVNYLKVPACLRASFYIYNGFSDIDTLIKSSNRIEELFGK